MAATFEEARSDLLDLAVHRYRNGYGLRSQYMRDKGLQVIPVMGAEGTPPQVMRVHASYGVREVEWQYAKQAVPPLMPAAADTTSGDTLLSATHWFHAPVGDPSGNLVFSAAGHFTYVQPGGGRGPDDEFPIDSHPFPTAVDAIGEYSSIPKAHSLGETRDSQLLRAVLDGRYNKEVIDSRVLSAYKIIG